jgi:hypothetical protein
MSQATGTTERATANTTAAPVASRFVPATPGPQPFWYYAAFGSGIGASNIVIGPISAGGGAPEILVGGNSNHDSGLDDFWQALRYNPTTGNYDQIFVSPIYPQSYYNAAVIRIGIANIIGDSNPEIVAMYNDGRIHIYDFATKKELGYIDTGHTDVQGLALSDLDGDGRAELLVTTLNTLLVYNGSGDLLWQVAGAGGSDVVVGQMDNDPALEIATTNGAVVDVGTHAVQWTRSGGFGAHLRLAPLPGENYQQLIGAVTEQAANGYPAYYVYAYDIARQLLRWSIPSTYRIDAVEVADVDNDGTPEVILGDGTFNNNQSSTVHVHDLITQAQKWAINNPEHGVTNIAVADVNGDGVVDLLWGAGGDLDKTAHLYVADTNNRHVINWQDLDLRGPFVGPAIGDLDGDGQPELVVCAYTQASNDYSQSGVILVFDLATLTLRAVSPPVVDGGATAIHDLKLRDVNGDGRMEIVIASEFGYGNAGVIEIYSFDSSNAFTRIWTNPTRPQYSPFSFVEVADLDGNGTQEIIAGSTVTSSAAPGSFVYIYDYPSTTPWTSVNFGAFTGVTGLLVDDLDGNGSKEIVALISGRDLYTFDGPSRQLRNLRQGTGFTTLGNRVSAAGLVTGDNAAVGHFLRYASNNYTENFLRQFGPVGSGNITGINAFPDGTLWTASAGVLNLRLPPSYSGGAWTSPFMGDGFGRFVATDIRDGQNRVFSSGGHMVAGLAYTVNANPTPTPVPTPIPILLPKATLLSPDANAVVTCPQDFSWLLSDNSSVLIYFAASANRPAGSVGTAESNAVYSGGGVFSLTPDIFSELVTDLGSSPTYYWTVGNPNYTLKQQYADWRPFTTAPPTSAPVISPKGRSFKQKTSVKLTAAPGATIYYTLDSHVPTRSSLIYTSPITLTATTPIFAKAVQTGYNDSAIVSALFVKKRGH